MRVTRRPLFIPLKREWFEAFKSGNNKREWRRYGPRWNKGTCTPRRRVTLSLGYSGARLYGRVSSFRTARAKGAAASIYGKGTKCAVIGIKLNARAVRRRRLA